MKANVISIDCAPSNAKVFTSGFTLDDREPENCDTVIS